jgi:hypothetical protein
MAGISETNQLILGLVGKTMPAFLTSAQKPIISCAEPSIASRVSCPRVDRKVASQLNRSFSSDVYRKKNFLNQHCFDTESTKLKT